MSIMQASAPSDRGASPLMSNNPFRNRINTQSPPATASRPISTNPFLDSNELTRVTSEQNSYTVATNVSPVDKATNLFSNMTIATPRNNSMTNGPRQANPGPRRPDNFAVQQSLRIPAHKPSISDEDQRHPMNKQADADIFADPSDIKSRDRKPRRNSESSIRDKRILDPEEEKRRRERRLRESKKVGSKSGKPNKKLDVIDKLDVTSIYGTGLFHHDGPFDACNPHRNRKREKYAPMQAFPKDSINMIVGGSGPVNKRMDYDKFHGYGQEAHIDFNEAAAPEERADTFVGRTDPSNAYNPTVREAVHGDESAGLGTSTFLEGAPASRIAIQRRDSEFETQQQDDTRPGLSRKKSLAQKIRGVRPRDRIISPEGRLGGPTSPPLTGQSDSGVNPFFKNYDSEMRKEPTQTINVEEQVKGSGRARAPSSPRRENELERRNTVESQGDDSSAKPSGLLGRMKSLKGRRPVRRDTSS